MKIFIRFLPVIMLLCISTEMSAQEFEVDGISYFFDKSEDVCVVAKGVYKGDVVIPATVSYKGHNYTITGIADNAFVNSRELKNITLPSTMKNLGHEMFLNCPMLVNINVDGQNTEYISVDGVLYSKGMISLECYPAGRISHTYMLPANVCVIMSNAFCGNPYLAHIVVDKENKCYTSIDGVLYDKEVQQVVYWPIGKPYDASSLPQTVTMIGDDAFYKRPETSIVIPDNITDIGISAFSNCKNLTSLTIGRSVQYLAGHVFIKCPNLRTIRVRSIVPPESADAPYFDEKVFKKAILYVPKSSLGDYKEMSDWSYFKHIRVLEE